MQTNAMAIQQLRTIRYYELFAESRTEVNPVGYKDLEWKSVHRMKDAYITTQEDLKTISCGVSSKTKTQKYYGDQTIVGSFDFVWNKLENIVWKLSTEARAP
uniref:SCP domain-containing protein n=1 Tax=Heterorhabditis bacteriophora TaxID=37862 RepID=A0A1I7XQ10_HETBA